MSYDKQNWQTGDVITANKLNHIEDGIANGGGVVVVHVTEEDDTFTLDKTWNELQELLASGALVATVDEYTGTTTMQFLAQTFASLDGTTYAVAFIGGAIKPDWTGETTVAVYSCESADGYPYFED